MGIAQTLGSQAANPRGALGWITAWIMPLFSDSCCGDLAGLLDLQPEDDVLEVGCGSGAFLKKRAAHCRHSVGLDRSDIQVRLARRRNRNRIAEGTTEIVHGDAAALPWEDGRFSAVTCNCLGCFPEPQRSLEEMHRVLQPEGRVALSFDYYQDEDRARRDEERWGMSCWTEGQVRQMIGDAGFSRLSVFRSNRILFIKGVRQ